MLFVWAMSLCFLAASYTVHGPWTKAVVGVLVGAGVICYIVDIVRTRDR